MSKLVKHFEECIQTHRLLSRGQRILVAVSGGLDSMVLLRLLHELASANGWRLTIAHFNHQLRGRSSEADERLVRQTAKELKLPVIIERANVRKLAYTCKLSLEMAARQLRHDFLARAAARMNILTIALAHHADDQIEHFFLRMLRGSGGEGLAGMKWRAPSPMNAKLDLVRPLLDQSKSDLRDFAAAFRIRFREDATNASLDIQRNRIRHELLPLLRRNYQPALDKTMLRVMAIVGAETEFAAQAAREWIEGPSVPVGVPAAESKTSTGPGPEPARPVGTASRRHWRVGECKFDELPIAVQRRCLHLQLLQHRIAPNFELVEELRLNPGRLVSVSELPMPFENPPGPHVRKEKPRDPLQAGNRIRLFAARELRGTVQLRREEPAGFESGSLAVDLDAKAGESLFDGVRISWRQNSRIFLGLPVRRDGSETFDANKIGSPIILRHWQAGDRFQPIGMKTAVKLQDLFINAKIPRARRKGLIVAQTANNDVFWVEGLRISERYKQSESTIRRLHWRWRRL